MHAGGGLMPTWRDLLIRAVQAAGGQNALARRLGMNHNAPRQWLLGIALPTPERYPVLADLTGLSVEAVAAVVMAERRRKWEARWAPLGPPSGAAASPVVPAPKSSPAPATARSRARRAKTGAVLLALGLGLAPAVATAGGGVAADNGRVEVFCGPRRRRPVSRTRQVA